MRFGYAQDAISKIKTNMVLLAGLAGIVVPVATASALTYQTPVNVQFTWGATLNVTLSSGDLVITNLAPGTYNDSNIITVNVNTNAAYGYTLSAATGDGTTYTNTNLVNGTNNFTSLTTSDSLASMDSANDNKWGYSFSSNAGTSWQNYSGLPYCAPDGGECTQGTALITTTNAADNRSIQFKIGAKASSDQPAGTYRNVINFFAVAVPEPTLEPINCSKGNVICYANNSLDQVEGTMGEQTASANASVTLLASNFSRTGYGFAGWNTAYDYSGTFYGPNETITTPADMSAGMPLYAVWVKSEGSIQDTNKVSSVCNRLIAAPTDGTANLSSVSALTDQRDSQTYAIAKLADGKCWMIENLRLDSTYTTSSNANLAQGYNSSFVGLSSSEEFARFANVTTANDLYSIDGSTTKTISGSLQSYRFPRYNNVNTSTRTDSPTANNNNNAFYSYGNYYTWPAVIADTTAYTTNNTSVTNTSICPYGWRLPQGGNKTRIEASDDNDFWNLTVDALNGGVNPANYDNQTGPYYTGTAEAGPVSKKLRSYPNNFVYSGRVNSGSVNYRGSYGDYWSSTAYSSTAAYNLNLDSSTVYPGTNGSNKYHGRTVRCIARSL